MSEEQDNPNGIEPVEASPSPSISGEIVQQSSGLLRALAELSLDVTSEVMKIAGVAGSEVVSAGLSFMAQPERLEQMAEAGKFLREMRELAGLTVDDLGKAISLDDPELLESAENGLTTLPFETTLRLASVLARHDPVPFVMRMTRTYNPSLTGVLNDLGIGRVTLNFERERQFLNIYRRHDEIRTLSDEEYDKVLQFTRGAFDMALEFVKSTNANGGSGSSGGVQPS